MNYRHAFHAGNFADVLKHVVLCLILEHLKRKDQPFRTIDTHAGSGFYDLSGPQAQRTGEWREGVGRLWGAPVPKPLAPWFEALRLWNPDGDLKLYPGSPALAAALSRPSDRLTFCELHPEEAALLRDSFSKDRRVKTIELDGWLALGAFLPPKERRGLVLIDPPFERPNEFDRLAEGFLKAARRWPAGCYLIWYPAKDVTQTARFLARLAEESPSKILRAELWVRAPDEADGLSGSGCLIVNPPFTLEADLALAGPDLSARLAQGRGARFILDWLVPERSVS